MRLTSRDTESGPWLQLEGESPDEWQRLEALAANGIRTCGPATPDVLLRLRAICGEVAASPVSVFPSNPLRWRSWGGIGGGCGS